jgi:N-acetylmuramoyl-L-alanine amidase
VSIPNSSSRRLKSQILRAAVRENEDTIAERLPVPLRRSRRVLRALGRRAWLLALPLGVLMVSGALAARGTSTPSMPGAPAIVDDDPARELPPNASLLAHPLSADVLALGVGRVVIDAGHGGIDTGATSADGQLEKDLALDLATRVQRLLVARGIEVTMTRPGDQTVSLKERATIANSRRGDLFVSIHLNSLAPLTARGVETYYLGPGEGPGHDLAAVENAHSGYTMADMRALFDGIYADARREESRHLAQSVQHALTDRLRAVDAGIADRGVKTAPFVVLVATGMPAILAEVSCVSNAADAVRLATAAHRQVIAEALASGIRTFIGQRQTLRDERKGPSEG